MASRDSAPVVAGERTQTMEQECRDHWFGPAYTKRKSSKKRWAYDGTALARRRRATNR